MTFLKKLFFFCAILTMFIGGMYVESTSGDVFVISLEGMLLMWVGGAIFCFWTFWSLGIPESSSTEAEVRAKRRDPWRLVKGVLGSLALGGTLTLLINPWGRMLVGSPMSRPGTVVFDEEKSSTKSKPRCVRFVTLQFPDREAVGACMARIASKQIAPGTPVLVRGRENWMGMVINEITLCDDLALCGSASRLK